MYLVWLIKFLPIFISCNGTSINPLASLVLTLVRDLIKSWLELCNSKGLLLLWNIIQWLRPNYQWMKKYHPRVGSYATALKKDCVAPAWYPVRPKTTFMLLIMKLHVPLICRVKTERSALKVWMHQVYMVIQAWTHKINRVGRAHRSHQV